MNIKTARMLNGRKLTTMKTICCGISSVGVVQTIGQSSIRPNEHGAFRSEVNRFEMESFINRGRLCIKHPRLRDSTVWIMSLSSTRVLLRRST